MKGEVLQAETKEIGDKKLYIYNTDSLQFIKHVGLGGFRDLFILLSVSSAV